MGKHSELTKRILRTIVVSGAMLGTPYAAHAQPSKSTPSTPDGDVAATKKQIANAQAELKGAKSEADRAAAKAKLDMLQAQLAALESQVKVLALQKSLDELTRKVNVAIDAVVAAQSDADRAAAKAKLEKLRIEKADLEKQLAALRPSNCKQQLDDKKWPDALDCSAQLAKTDAKTAADVQARATAEAKAEAAMRSMADAIAAKDLPRAKQELDKIAMDSVYRTDAQAKYDAAVKAQKRPRADNDRPVGRGFVLS